MNQKNISTQSHQLLSYFNEKNQKCFYHFEALKVFPRSTEKSITELLRDMTKRGLLMRIRTGIYCIIPFEQDPGLFIPDWHLVAKYLVRNTEYYIGYYSALQIHNLITQPSLKEQVVVNRQIRPSTMKVKNVTFQFIYHNEKHFFGVTKNWIDQFQKIQCSDLEKTIVDCLFKPEYAGGIPEIAKAIYISKEKIKFELLLQYVLRFQSQAVIKRLGFLLELLEIKSSIIEELSNRKTLSIILLDTDLPKQGKIVSRWSIQQNIDNETIKSSIYT